jgi:hypothetical protein
MDDEDPGLRGLLIRAREVIEESSPGNDVLIADMDRAIDGGAGSFSVGIARCQLRGCGRAWWAISEEVGNTARLSGFECPHCGGLDGRYEGERVRRSTEQEARAVAEQMRNEVSDYEQWLDAEEREWATKAPFSVVRRALADRPALSWSTRWSNLSATATNPPTSSRLLPCASCSGASPSGGRRSGSPKRERAPSAPVPST